MPQETECSLLSSSILCGSKGQASKEGSVPPAGAPVFLTDQSACANVSRSIYEVDCGVIWVIAYGLQKDIHQNILAMKASACPLCYKSLFDAFMNEQ